jgi:hypothetical protein
MLRQLASIANRVGLQVRFEAFDVASTRRGGLCRLHGATVLFIDAHATTLDKVGVLCDALARFDIEALYVPPLLRARIQRGL